MNLLKSFGFCCFFCTSLLLLSLLSCQEKEKALQTPTPPVAKSPEEKELEKRRAYYALLATQAEAGESEAQRDLGAWFLCSDYQKAEKEKAKHYLRLASAKGDADSEYLLGELLWQEAQSPEEKKEAQAFIEKAAQKQHPRALQRQRFL